MVQTVSTAEIENKILDVLKREKCPLSYPELSSIIQIPSGQLHSTIEDLKHSSHVIVNEQPTTGLKLVQWKNPKPKTNWFTNAVS